MRRPEPRSATCDDGLTFVCIRGRERDDCAVVVPAASPLPSPGPPPHHTHTHTHNIPTSISTLYRAPKWYARVTSTAIAGWCASARRSARATNSAGAACPTIFSTCRGSARGAKSGIHGSRKPQQLRQNSNVGTSRGAWLAGSRTAPPAATCGPGQPSTRRPAPRPHLRVRDGGPAGQDDEGDDDGGHGVHPPAGGPDLDHPRGQHGPQVGGHVVDVVAGKVGGGGWCACVCVCLATFCRLRRK